MQKAALVFGALALHVEGANVVGLNLLRGLLVGFRWLAFVLKIAFFAVNALALQEKIAGLGLRLLFH